MTGREKTIERFNELARDHGQSKIAVLLVDKEMLKRLIWAATPPAMPPG
jgi:hypothetical protein